MIIIIMSVLAISCHGHGHHRHLRIPSVVIHPSLSFSLQQHSTDGNNKHCPATKYALQDHLKYHVHPLLLLASSASARITAAATSTTQQWRILPLHHQSTRYYHTTSKNKRVPFLILRGFVGLTFQQINLDWENY
jgi:hypothetical protein